MSDPVAETIQTYDAVAADYARRTADADHAAAAADWLAAQLGSGSRVADLGCGPGQLSELLRHRGLRPVALDRSASMLVLASAVATSVRADLRRLPFATGSLDGVWSYASLLHVPRHQTVATVREWRRAVRVGGRLVLSTSLGGDEGWELVPYAAERGPAGPLHRWFVHRDEDEITADLTAAGWLVEATSRRRSHRDWLTVQARA